MDRPHLKFVSALGLGALLATAGCHNMGRVREIPPNPPLTREGGAQFHSDPNPLPAATNGPNQAGGGPVVGGGAPYGLGGASGAGNRGQIGESQAGFDPPADDGQQKPGEMSMPAGMPNL